MKSGILYLEGVEHYETIRKCLCKWSKAKLQPQTIEQKLDEAIRNFEAGRTYSKKEVWHMAVFEQRIWIRFIIRFIK